jgi:L-rhamnonate dehydratase
MPRITRVYAVHPPGPGGPRDWRMILGQILVAVETDAGMRGFGVGGGGPVGVYLVHTLLRPLLVGQSFDSTEDIERLWERMYRDTLAYGRKGLAIMAISGVDLALWDAFGHSQNKSVADLLGGARQTRLPCYATTRDPDEAVAQGFTAIKLGLAGAPPDEAVKLVAETRQRIGPRVKLMIDAWGQWSFDDSLRTAQRLAEHGLTWLEEPLPPDDHKGYARLSVVSPVPIAGGEHEYTVHGFRELAEVKAHPIWQPDVCWTGGLTQLRAIYALAAEEGTRVIPHRGGEVWSLPAIAALDPDPLAESGRPWMTWIEGQPSIVDGYIDVPDTPGFGVKPSADVEALLTEARAATPSS